MELPDDAPKIPKLPFIASDAVLISVAAYLAYAAGSPLPASAIYSIAGCVGLGALLAGLPFVIDYTRRQDALLSERQNALEALARTTSSAVEQASIAAGGLHEIGELTQRNLRAAEQLPHKLQERINEFHRVQDESLAAELESLQQEVTTLRASDAEKLDSTADKVQRAVAELATFEAILRKHASGLAAAMKRTEQLIGDTPARPASAKAASALPAVRRGADEVSGPGSAALAAGGSTAAESTLRSSAAPGTTGAGRSAATPASRAAGTSGRKSAGKGRTIDTTPPDFPNPLFNDTAPLDRTSAAPESVPPFQPAEEAGDEATQLSPDEANPEPARSSDGVTRLIATAYIGIGNKLFLRGHGSGLSWDKGVPLQFISIGKWRWESADASGPIVAKLFKNDQIECTSVGEIRLQPGDQREVTAHF